MNGPAQNLLLWLLCLLLQAAIITAFGEYIARQLCGWRPTREGVPEFSFCLGLAAYLLTGAFVLPFALSARSIPIAVILVASALWVYRSPTLAPLPEPLRAYADFRRTTAFRLCLVLLLIFVAAVSSARFLWLLERTTAQGVTLGTPIFDDVRTLGFPLALAADGFPLRSPIAMEMLLPYAVAPFTWSAGWIAWLPSLALPILLADVVVQTLFYCFTVFLLACAFIPSIPARVLLTATAFLGASVNLWDLGIKAQWPWVRFFFGYFRLNQLYSTIAWDPMRGVIWIPNHVLGFSAILLAVLCFVSLRQRRLALLFAIFSAASSLDMTVMALATMAALTALPVLRHIWHSRQPAEWVWPAVRICLATAATVVLVNLPSVLGRVDSPYDPVFPIISVPQFNAGMSGSHYGLYILFFAAVLWLWRPPAPFRTLWIAPLAAGFFFTWAFEYHSIWFWRFTFAGHFLFGMWFALHYPPVRTRLYTILWSAILLAGVVQLGINLHFVPLSGPFVPPGKADSMRWIAANTPISAKVAEFRPAEATLVPDAGFLRTGNRAGARPYDRSHALIGYRDYMKKFASLHAGVAANDFVLAAKTERDFLPIFESCGARQAFSTETHAVFAIESLCRQRLNDPSLQPGFTAWNDKLAMRAALAANTAPEKLDTPILREYVILHPEAMWLLRQRMEALWGANRADEAARILEPVVAAHPALAEAHYSYAFSLSISGLDKEKAVRHFTTALDLGYSEFWVRYNRGAAYISMHRYPEAIADLQRARALNPSHTGVANLLRQLPQGVAR